MRFYSFFSILGFSISGLRSEPGLGLGSRSNFSGYLKGWFWLSLIFTLFFFSFFGVGVRVRAGAGARVRGQVKVWLLFCMVGFA